MAKTVDLRTYIALEKAFVRRLQRSWRIQSAPIYAKIAQACNDHKWDEARRLVTDLDMTEVGTQNREWITYMLLSCAVFGANMVAKGRPSFVGVGTFDVFLKQVTNNFLMYLENAGTTRVQAEALQSIAEDEAKTKALKWDESKHPRDKEGQFTESGISHAAGMKPGYLGGHPIQENMEGGGPARAAWVKLYKASEAAQVADKGAYDALMAARKRAQARHINPDTGIADFYAVDKDPEVVEAEKQHDVTGIALIEVSKALEKQYPVMRREVVTNLANGVAKEMGIDPSLITVVDKDPTAFNVGDRHFVEAGHFTPFTGKIELNSRHIGYNDADEVRGTVAHEISHLIYHQLQDAVEQERQKFAVLSDMYIGPQRNAWFHERFEWHKDPNQLGFGEEIGEFKVRPEWQERMAKEFPATAVAAEITGGMFSGHLVGDKAIKENGHSLYAKSYWTEPALNQAVTYEKAINETTAEVTRYLKVPKSWDEMKNPKMDESFGRFTVAMHAWYKEDQRQKEEARLKQINEFNAMLPEMEKRWAREDAQT